MPKVACYFFLHQPYRLADLSVLDLDNGCDYFATPTFDQNREVFLKVTQKSYLPMLTLLLDCVEKYPDFKFSFSATGVFLEQAQIYAPEVIELLKKLTARHEQVEMLTESYYHGLTALYSETEFAAQIKLHQDLTEKLFGLRPKVFRNTEMIYNNYIGWQIAKLGFTGTLVEAVDRFLNGQSRTQLWRSQSTPSLPLMLKHAQLSDDIAFRFSDKNWSEWPLTSEKYLHWLNNYYPEEIIGLFMDFETFGEHQWENTGIFDFFATFVMQAVKQKNLIFTTPSLEFAQIKNLNQLPVYQVEAPISWADVDRDLSAWRSNVLQEDTLKQIFSLEKEVLASQDEKLIQDWRRLLTSDHFYYMCTKYFADGDVHSYFSAYNSPFEAYRRYCLVLADLKERLASCNNNKKIVK